jgi:RNA polymerase sigma factor (sigma-70 family)
MNSVMGEDQQGEPELLERLREGDEAAFSPLYAQYRNRLYSFLLRLSGRPDLAEELSQEVWLRLVANPPLPRPGVPLGPWLYRVARNLYFSYLRSRNMDATRTSELTAISWPTAAQPGPWEELAEKESHRILRVALAGLPPAYRECLLLVTIGGLTPGRAAETLDLPAPTFRKRLSRAREMLAQRLSQSGNNGQEAKPCLRMRTV